MALVLRVLLLVFGSAFCGPAIRIHQFTIHELPFVVYILLLWDYVRRSVPTLPICNDQANWLSKDILILPRDLVIVVIINHLLMRNLMKCHSIYVYEREFGCWMQQVWRIHSVFFPYSNRGNHLNCVVRNVSTEYLIFSCESSWHLHSRKWISKPSMSSRKISTVIFGSRCIAVD